MIHIDLVNRIETRSALIGFFGMGYVGLPLMLRFVEEGFTVIGFDIDESKVGKLNSGRSYIESISSVAVAAAKPRPLRPASPGKSARGRCSCSGP